MADPVIDALNKVIKAGSDTAQLTSALKDLNDLQKELLKAGNFLDYKEVSKAVAQINKLKSAHDKLNESAKKSADNVELSNEEIQDSVKAAERAEQSTEALTSAVDSYNKNLDRQIRKHKEIREAKRHEWETNSILGRTYKMLAGEVGNFVQTLTSVLTLRAAYNQYAEGLIVRNKLIQQSFLGINDPANRLDKSFTSRLADAALEGKRMADVMAKTGFTLKTLGYSAEEVGPTFEKLSRITGTRNPESLKKLTEASAAVARSLKIDLSEATEYVANRLDKFGGSASGGLLSMNEMITGISRLNNAFGHTVIRGDDVIRTINDITNNTSAYAIDQKALTTVLTNATAKMQALGKSYDFSFRTAKALTEGLTDKAPPWVKYVAGQNITNELINSIKGLDSEQAKKVFTEKYGDIFEAAKSGLTDEIFTTLTDKSLSEFDRMQLISEKIRNTQLGVLESAKVVAGLGSQAGPTVVMKSFGLETISQAQEFIKLSTEIVKLDKERTSLYSASATTLAKRFSITEQEAALVQGNKEAINSLLDIDQKRMLIELDRVKANQEVRKDSAELVDINEKILAVQRRQAVLRSQMSKETNADAKARIQAEIDSTTAALNALEDKKAEKLGKADKVGTDQQQADLAKATKDIIDTAFPGAAADPGIALEAIKSTSTHTKLILGFLIGGGLFKFGGQKLLQVLQKMGGIGGFGGGAAGGAATAGGVAAAAEKGILSSVLKSGGGFLRGTGRFLSTKMGGALVSGLFDAPEAYETYNRQGGGVRGGALAATRFLSTGLGALGATVGSAVPVAGTLAGGAAGYAAGQYLEGLIGKYAGTPSGVDAAAAAQAILKNTPATPTPTAVGDANLEGSIIGGLNPDGSINIRVTNFLNGVSGAISYINQNAMKIR